MAVITTHKDLVVWQKSVALASKVYAATRRLPSDERADLGRELRSAAIAIASNIAEGSARRARTEFLQSLYVARGCLSQIETQVMVAADQGLIDERDALLDEIAAVGRLLNGLIRSLMAESRVAHAKACLPATTACHPPHPPRTGT